VLLIICMMVSGHAPHHFALADLALTQTAVGQPKAIRENAIRVMISRDGSIFFRNVKIDPTQLPQLIQQAVKEGAERRVYLTVDARAKYGDAKVVYDAIAAGGVRDICLMAEKIDSHR
jgi:biopolymer transport protein ExbD